MKTIAAFALGLGMMAFLGLPIARTQDKKDEKKDEKKTEAKGDAPKLEGKYTLVSGKKNDKPIDEDAKKGTYTFTADKVTIEGMGVKFVMGYKVDAKTDPVNIDMEILEGPEGTKGSKAQGIVEMKGDTLKLAYMMEKDKRPKTFDGKEGFSFELKKAK